jgi:hypothetical protein
VHAKKGTIGARLRASEESEPLADSVFATFPVCSPFFGVDAKKVRPPPWRGEKSPPAPWLCIRLGRNGGQKKVRHREKSESQLAHRSREPQPLPAPPPSVFFRDRQNNRRLLLVNETWHGTLQIGKNSAPHAGKFLPTRCFPEGLSQRIFNSLPGQRWWRIREPLGPSPSASPRAGETSERRREPCYRPAH